MKSRLKSRLFPLVLGLVSACFGTAWAGEFVRTYGGPGSDAGSSVTQTADGGFLAAGATNSTGAGMADLWIVRTDFDGNLLWEKSYGGTHAEPAEITVVRETADRGIIVAGATGNLGAGGVFDGWVLRLDGAGTVLWEMSYGGPMNDFLFRPVEMEGGRLIALGATGSFGAGAADIWVLWIDEHGQLTREMAYGGTGSDMAIGAALTAAGLLLCGTTDSFGAGGDDGLVMLAHPETGDVIWSKSYGGTADESLWGAAALENGGFVAVGRTKSFGAGGSDVWVIRLDENGNPLWEKTYGGSGDDDAWSVAETGDGSLAVLGTTDSFGGGQEDVWLLILDESGNIRREYTYGGSGREFGAEIRTTRDLGLIVAGATESFAVGTADLWLLKLTGEGAVPDPICVHLFGTSAAQVTPSAATVATAAVGAVSSLSSGTVSALPTTAIIMSIGSGLSTTPLCFTPSLVLPQPASSEVVSCGPAVEATPGTDVFSTVPMGLGDLAGGALNLNINIPYFDGLVDVFVGVSSPVLGDEIFLVAEDGSLRNASLGVSPWRFETHGGYVVDLVGPIPLEDIPLGEYTFYVAVTPPGTWDHRYVWYTTLGLP